jgi:hypothetical protein
VTATVATGAGTAVAGRSSMAATRSESSAFLLLLHILMWTVFSLALIAMLVVFMMT